MLRRVLPTSRDARRILVGTLLSAVGRGLTLPYLFVYLAEVRGISAGTVGLLVGWMGAVSLVLAPLGGSLVDRLGARRVVLPLFLIAALGTASLAFVTGPASAFASLTLVALAFSAIWAAQNTILASLVDEAERQRTFGLNFTLLNLGIGVGGVVGGLLVDPTRLGTFQLLYLIDGLSYLGPAVILLGMPHVGRRVVTPAGEIGSPAAEALSQPKAGGYLDVLRDRTFVRFFVFGLVLITFGYAQVEVGFTAFARVVAGVPAGVLGLAFACNTLVIVVSQLFVVRWLEGRSRTRALALAAGTFACSWVILAGAGLAGTAAPALAVAGVVGCTAVFAIGETLMSPVMPAITNALATDLLRGRYNALASMTWGLSGVVGPVAAGPLIGAGHGFGWVVMVIFGCLAAAVLALMLRRQLTPVQDGRRVLEDGLQPARVGAREEDAAPCPEEPGELASAQS